MADYWKSNAKKFCEICKIWIADNKISVERHEQGMRHKDAVRERLRDSEAKAREREKERADLAQTLVQMEQAAHATMQREERERSGRSTASELRQVERERIREEKGREAARVQAAVTQRAGMVDQGAAWGQFPATAPMPSGSSMGSTVEDPRAVAYKEWMEKRKKEEKIAEEERIRDYCEEKAAHYTAKQAAHDEDHRRQMREKDAAASKHHGKSGGKGGGAKSKHHQHGQEKGQRSTSDAKAAGQQQSKALGAKEPPKSDGAVGESEGVVGTDAPAPGPWVRVVPAAGKSMGNTTSASHGDSTAHSSSSTSSARPSQSSHWKEEADELEMRMHDDPKAFAFAEKSLAEGSLGFPGGKRKLGSGGGSKPVVEFRKRKVPDKGSIRERKAEDD